MRKILLAGATGYLGSHIAKKLIEGGTELRVISRAPDRLVERGIQCSDLFKAEVTRPETLVGCCEGIDTVITTVGITRQKDGLTYIDVDYQANLNLLNEAKKAGVRKFVYVSVLNGDKLRHLKICDAKERFVERLQSSRIEYCVVRPNGFFSDMSEFLTMAQNGTIYILGSGQQKSNPIHGEDLARACVETIDGNEKLIEIGGPELMTYNDIAAIAFEVAGKEPKITRIPGWIRTSILWTLRTFTTSKFYGPIEFFMTVTAIDMIAPQYGNHRLKDYLKSLL